MTLLVKAPVLFQAILAFLCVLQATADFDDQGYVIIDTPVGQVLGTSFLLTAVNVTTTGSPFYQFLGIPYAKPPVGELRFKPTEPPEPWKGTYDALVMPPACPQYAENKFPWYDTLPGQSEDCLYLNVWTPKNAVTGYNDGDERQKRAVKLYIHGGGWFTGGSIRMGYYAGHGDANDLDVPHAFYKEYIGLVVVTVNYRLGPLGFLSSGTDDAPGNAGLHDILTAMKWVHNNIASFGGDPDNIVLFGQGVGAIAASLFLTVPTALPLFSRMVLSGATLYTLKALKGAAIEHGDSYDNNIKLAERLAKAVGCGSTIAENPKDTIDCLKGVDASSLVKTLASFSPAIQQPPYVFLPQFGRDDLFPLADPFAVLDGRINLYEKKDAYLAYTAEEGTYLLTVNNPDVFGLFGEEDDPIDDVQAKSMLTKFLENFPQPDDLAEELLGKLDARPSFDNREKVYKIMGHVNTICPIVYLADNLVNDSHNVYVEEKEFFPPYNTWAEWMGTVHFDNVQLDFLHEEPDYNVPLVVNGQAYNLTYEQAELSFYNRVLVARFLYGYIDDDFVGGVSFFRKYKPKGSDPNDRRRHLGGEYCEILKKYFVK